MSKWVFHSRLIMKLKTNRIKHTFDVSDHIFVSACLHAYDHLLPVLIFLLGWKSSFLLLIFLCFFSLILLLCSVFTLRFKSIVFRPSDMYSKIVDFFFLRCSHLYSVALIRSLSPSYIFSPIQFFFFSLLSQNFHNCIWKRLLTTDPINWAYLIRNCIPFVVFSILCATLSFSVTSLFIVCCCCFFLILTSFDFINK